MVAVAVGGIQVCVESTGGCKSVTLNTWNLYQSAHRVASHAEMMFKSHFGSIFYLRRTAAKQLANRCRSHGASHANLTLASHIGTRYGGVLLHYVAHQSGCGYGMENLCVAEVVALLAMVEHCRQHATRATGGSRDDGAA